MTFVILNIMLRALFIIIFVILTVSIVMSLLLSSRDRAVIFSREKTFKFAGLDRKYLIYKPKQITQSSRIIVGLHAFSDSPKRFAYYTGLHNEVNSNDVVIYPKSVEPKESEKSGWNAGFCCGSGWKNKADDVGYIVSLINYVKSELGLSNASTYLVGFSNGSFMAERVASEHPGMVDGIVVASGTIGTTNIKLIPKSAVPVLLMHGKKDQTVLFEGGAAAHEPDFNWLPFSETISVWQSVNGAETPTKSIVYPEDGHKWHDWRILNIRNHAPQATKEAVKFINSL